MIHTTYNMHIAAQSNIYMHIFLTVLILSHAGIQDKDASGPQVASCLFCQSSNALG